MFGSQALETAIGLAMLFFVLATATSAVVELVAKRLKKRHRDLEQAIGTMLAGGEVGWSSSQSLDAAFRGTTIYRSAAAAAGKAGVTYFSARSFADAAVELARTAQNLPPGLAGRMDQVHADVGDDLTRFKAGLESWFDETMAGVESQYKKWATTWLFTAGLVLAVLVNASAIDVAADLWKDQATRAVVVAAAESTAAAGQQATKIEDAARSADALDELGLPVGWTVPPFDASHGARWWLSHAVGWLLTAALLMLGAPFWFDLLSRLVSLRNSGKGPESAPNDDTSATAAVIRADTVGAPASPAGRRSAPSGSTVTDFLGATVTRPLPALDDQPSGTASRLARRLAGKKPVPGHPPIGKAPLSEVVDGGGPVDVSTTPAARDETDRATSEDQQEGRAGTAMSDFDTRPGDEIEPLGEGEEDAFGGPDLAAEDVTVDDIHERDETDPDISRGDPR